MIEYLTQLAADPAAWAALVTLITMEVVLGIDNLIFISVLTNKLPVEQRERARRIGIGCALGMRLVLLGTIAIIVQLTEPVIEVFGQGLSWRDLILIAGGLFLVWKATKEIHHTVDPEDHKETIVGQTATLTVGGAIFQILLLDLVFSVDSIITAVGMTDHIAIMYIAVIVAVAVMLLAADPLNEAPRRAARLRRPSAGAPGVLLLGHRPRPAGGRRARRSNRAGRPAPWRADCRRPHPRPARSPNSAPCCSDLQARCGPRPSFLAWP